MSELGKITEQLSNMLEMEKELTQPHTKSLKEALGSSEYETALEQGLEMVQQLKHDFDMTYADFGDAFRPEVNEQPILDFLQKMEGFLSYCSTNDILDACLSQEKINKYFEDLINIVEAN